VTRHSKRDIERDLKDLVGGRGAETVREWIRQRTLEQFQAGGSGAEFVSPGDGPFGEGITVYIDRHGDEWRTPAAELPAWVDVDEDLPVEASGDERNPFLVAEIGRQST